MPYEAAMELESRNSTGSNTSNKSTLSAAILKYDEIIRELAKVRREETKSIVKYRKLIGDHQLSALVKEVKLRKDDVDLLVPDLKTDNLLQLIEQREKSENSIETMRLKESFKVKTGNFPNELHLIHSVMHRIKERRE